MMPTTALALLLTTGLLAGTETPATVPEATAWARTSTTAEVSSFMTVLSRRYRDLQLWSPPGGPRRVESGKAIQAWHLPATGSDPLRVYLNGNIHAGEVEGKEAIQILVRELLQGKHPDVRRGIEFVVMPCYNAEGTDALDPKIRRYQPNPASGVGRRETDRGLDLNRDAMKAEAPSTRWFLAMLNGFDPHAVFDLHTTNGSTHGFHLTWSPALTLGGDPALLAFNRRMLVEVRDQLKAEGLPTWDYGNFAPDEKAKTAPERWETYDPLPRYLTNYAGLQGRLGILSEAYVYRTFEQRVRDTRTFLLACLRWMAAHPEEVRTATAQRTHSLPAGQTLPLAARLKETERAPFELVDLERNADGRPVKERGRQTLTLPSFATFEEIPEGRVVPPTGYLLDGAWAARIQPILEAHGIKTFSGKMRLPLPLSHFIESSRKVSSRPFQGVFALDLQGRWSAEPSQGQAAWSVEDLDHGLWVPLTQPRGRVAFYLLDPRSPDGLFHWGAFHSALLRGGWGEAPRFPVLAVGAPLEKFDALTGAPGAMKAE